MLPLRTFLMRLPAWAVDAGLAALFAVGTCLTDGFDPDNQMVGRSLAWDVALAAPLLVRRRAPALLAAAVGAMCLIQWITDSPADGDVVVLVALYTLGVHETRRWVVVTAAVAAGLGVVLAVVSWVPPAHAWLLGSTATGTVAAALVLGLYVRTRRAYLTSIIARAEAAERDRDVQARIAVDAERARMAREMHDVVAHSLSVMITLNDAAARVADPQRARRAAEQASEVGREALAEMQRLLGVLRPQGPPEMAPQPGVAQLPELIAMVRSAGFPVELSVAGDLERVPGTLGLALYRLVQESLTNVVKHGRNVTRVQVDVRHHGGWVAVVVRNDGDVVHPAGETAPGHGLAGMRERAHLFGGTVDAAPAAGGGWIVDATFAADDASRPAADSVDAPVGSVGAA